MMFGNLFSGDQKGSAQKGKGAAPTNERLSARQELLHDVVSIIEDRAPHFRYVIFNVEDYKYFGADVPTRFGDGVHCGLGEFVIVDADGDVIPVFYADLGYKPGKETIEYLAERVAEYYHAHVWKNERMLDEGTAWRHRGVAGCVVYTDESYPAFRALWDKIHGTNLREC